MSAIRTTARAIRVIGDVYRRKWSFLGAFFVVFFLSFSLLLGLGLVPNDSTRAALTGSPLVASDPRTLSPNVADAPVLGVRGGELPLRIDIPAIGLSAKIENPTAVDVATLDAHLLKGAVRYPTSAKLGENGNVILFGHSSYLPVVHNQAFKAFNDIQKLRAGDQITVYSSGAAYVYAVEEVKEVSAASGAIPLTVSGAKLTLSTCDSFGAKSDRFVVTATLVESHSLSS
jgi:LPXTG-site transpeptidase (sortase) family protein